ncbi:MAG TPA: hypothetical protein PKO15_11825 [Fibrobacteria bacterium]|nr:hypothetical protein [Fibrobacteria bacterium]
MNFPKIPNMPKPQAISPAAPAFTPGIQSEVSAGPANGVVGLSAPNHFDPNNPSVHVDATVHNPTGVGGDLHVNRDVKIPTEVPAVSMPSLPGGGGASGGSGLSMPHLGNPLSGISAPDLSLPSLGNPFSGLSAPSFSMPSLGNPFSGISAPELPSLGNPFGGLSLPELPSWEMPRIDFPGGGYKPAGESPWRSPIGVPGFRFPDLPSIGLPDDLLPDWDLEMPDLIPDLWDGDSESEPAEPHHRTKDDGLDEWMISF